MHHPGGKDRTLTMTFLKRAVSEVGLMLRETGQAMDRLGMRALNDYSFKETFSRHRAVMNLYDKRPWVSNDSYVAPSAAVIGDVKVGDRTSVMYGAVVRADAGPVELGAMTTLGERVVVCTSKRPSTTGLPPTSKIGNYVRVGQGSTLYACTVHNGAVIGTNCVVGDGAIVGEHGVLQDGAVLPAGCKVPAYEEWGGSPLRKVRELSADDGLKLKKEAEAAADAARDHALQFLPHGTAYQELEEMEAAARS